MFQVLLPLKRLLTMKLHAKDNMSYEEFFFYVSSFITSFKRLLTMNITYNEHHRF